MTDYYFPWGALSESDRCARILWALTVFREDIHEVFIEVLQPLGADLPNEITEHIDWLRTNGYATADGGGHLLFECDEPEFGDQLRESLAAAAAVSVDAEFAVAEWKPLVISARVHGLILSLSPRQVERARDADPDFFYALEVIPPRPSLISRVASRWRAALGINGRPADNALGPRCVVTNDLPVFPCALFDRDG